MELIKPVVVHVGPVKRQDAVRFVALASRHLDLVLRPGVITQKLGMCPA